LITTSKTTAIREGEVDPRDDEEALMLTTTGS